MSDKQVLETSDEAATFVTGIEGWVDGNGRFWGKDERAARWNGCTHIICPGCKKETSKNYIYCPECREKSAAAQYEECSVEGLRLIICIPNYLKPLEDDFFCEDMAEDGELPQDVIEALNSLNEVISKQEPISWSPGKYAADISERA